MSWCRLILGLGLVKLVVAAAGATTTTTVATKTNCPLYYLTPAVPSPTKSVCGVAGVLGKANTLHAYCGNRDLGLGERASGDQPTICYRACARDPKCVSYSVDPAHNNCYTYGKSLADMAFQPNPNKYQFFYNIRDCYNCTLPQPTRSACATTPQPKSPKPVNYTCGAPGMEPSWDQAFYFAQIVPPYTPSSCYEICANLFDPVGVCESFIMGEPMDQYETCYIYDKPLTEVPFVPSKGGVYYGYNLRGCFTCNVSYPPVPSCIPSRRPVNIGVRNGNFQDTYYDTRFMRTKLQEWGYDGSAFTANGTNKNVFMNLTAVQTGLENQPSPPSISQTIYGLNTNYGSGSQLYNFSFDLAIPGSYHSTKTVCNMTVPGNTYEKPLFVRDDDRRYTGTTLRPYGPYLVNVSSNSPGYDVYFYADCYQSDKARKANATFWIDNFRITQNGRDIGF